MIVFFTVAYVLLLVVLTKIGLVPNSKGTWLTVIPYMLILVLGFFIPMQWGAPGGDVRTLTWSVPITPNVVGEVIEVAVVPNQSVKAGDVLFKLDPAPYQAGARCTRSAARAGGVAPRAIQSTGCTAGGICL
ncbi:MAG: biotin/lipoyl-binding protein [Deltaproteobacteria bacterium]|nr:biotin/lipoyl-binding protein [Deltaproteobacteria bacterium]